MSVIDDISRRSREQILARVAKGYKQPNFQVQELPDPVCHMRLVHEGETFEQVTAYSEEEAKAAVQKAEAEHKAVDLLATFKANVCANKFDLHESSPDKVLETVEEILKQSNVKSLMYPQNIGLDLGKIKDITCQCFNQSIDNPEVRHAVFNTDASIVNCVLGVASHGVVMVCSSPEQPRTLSLTFPLCIMLLKKTELCKSLEDGLHLMKERYGEHLPSNVLYIAGPSRTSDIELITVFGVHGPQHVHLVLY